MRNDDFDTPISAILRESDHIICEVDSLDLWIRVHILIESPFKDLEAEFLIRISKQMGGSEFSKIG